MKKLVSFIFIFMSIFPVFPQKKVTDFHSIMTTTPLSKKIKVINISKSNGDVVIKQQTIKRKNRIKLADHDQIIDIYTQECDLMGELLDSLQLINYNVDTIYLISNRCLDTVSLGIYLVKTNKNSITLGWEDGKIKVRSLYDYYTNPTFGELVKSEYLFHKTVFSWDIDGIVKLIDSSDLSSSGDDYILVRKIVISDGYVIERETIQFNMPLYFKKY